MNGNGKNGRSRVAAMALRCQPDSRLVGLVREGHDTAFEEIVRRYRAPLVAYAGGIVPDHHAEDVVQDALTRAHGALSRSRAEMNLKPWLFTIVRNGALNSLRNEPVHVHLDENYDGVPQPPDVAARREELAALTASVKKLPDQQREALVKRELEGRSHDEIGASLGLSAGAVRGLIYRARAALRDGAGMLIPLPVLRALLSSTPATPEATGAAGAAAAGLAGGGGGIALKAGATLGVAVIAVGSGIAVQHRGSGSAQDHASPAHAARPHGTDGSGRVTLADAALPGDGSRSGGEGHGSGSSGPGSGGDGSSGSSGPGPGGHSGGGGSSSGPGSGTGGSGGGQSGSGSSGDDGSSGSGTSSGSGDDGGGGSTGGHDGGGTSGSGSDDGTSGSSGDGGSGSSGSGSSGDGGGDTTTIDGGGDGGSSGDGGGDTTTTPTTTTDGSGDSGTD